MVPLSRDQHNNAFDVPEEAAYWRVRRHTGGRPSTVLGPDGEPLFVALTSDKPELRANGCNGSLRLEAVDGDYRSVNAPVAFVELGHADDVPRNAAPSSDGNLDLVRVGFESMTRTVEAMQRAQVERERAYAVKEKALADAQIAAQRMNTDLIIALCERASGSKPLDALSVVKEQLAVQRVIDGNQRNAGLLAAPLPAATDNKGGGLPPWLTGLLPLTPLIADTAIKIFAKDKEGAEEMRRNAAPYIQLASTLQGGETAAANVDVSQDEARPTPPRSIREALAQLDDDEAEAFDELWDRLDDTQIATVIAEARRIASVEARTDWLRRLLAEDDRTTAVEDATRIGTAAPAFGAIAVPPALFPVLMKLTPEEQVAGSQLVSTLDRATIDKLAAKLTSVSSEEALVLVREIIANARKRSASVAQRAVASALSDANGEG